MSLVQKLKEKLQKAVPFVLSLSMHIAILLVVSLLQGGKGDSDTEDGKDQGKSQNAENVDIAPKATEVTIIEKEPPPEQGEDIIIPEPPPQPQTEGLTECEGDSWYGGIGIQQNFLTDAVDRVEPGYPAYKAGLRIGDQIRQVSSKEGKEIRGEPGTQVSLWVFRPSTNESFLLEIIRDRICTWKKKGEP
jgi:hypothetical protein